MERRGFLGLVAATVGLTRLNPASIGQPEYVSTGPATWTVGPEDLRLHTFWINGSRVTRELFEDAVVRVPQLWGEPVFWRS